MNPCVLITHIKSLSRFCHFFHLLSPFPPLLKYFKGNPGYHAILSLLTSILNALFK